MAPSAPGPPPEWAAELPPLIHAGLGDEEVDATRGRLIARMRAAPPSLKTFVETLGPFLTSDLEPQRDRAMMLLAECLAALPAMVTSTSDADFLLRFFVARFTDWPANTGAFRGARTLARRYKVDSSSATSPSSSSPAFPSLSALTACARQLCDGVEARALSRRPRQAALELLLELSSDPLAPLEADRETDDARAGDEGDERPDEAQGDGESANGDAELSGLPPPSSSSSSLSHRLVASGVPLLEAAVAFSDGERDPRCLSASLPLLAAAARATERAEAAGDEAAAALLEAYAEDAFEILASYLPIAFSRARGNERARARRRVADALDRALAGAEVFLPALPTLAAEKLLEDAEEEDDEEASSEAAAEGRRDGEAKGPGALGASGTSGARSGGAIGSQAKVGGSADASSSSAFPFSAPSRAALLLELNRRCPCGDASAAPSLVRSSALLASPRLSAGASRPDAPGARVLASPLGPPRATCSRSSLLQRALRRSSPSRSSPSLPAAGSLSPPPACVEILSPLHRVAAAGAFSDDVLAPVAPRVFEALRATLCGAPEGGAGVALDDDALAGDTAGGRSGRGAGSGSRGVAAQGRPGSAAGMRSPTTSAGGHPADPASSSLPRPESASGAGRAAAAAANRDARAALRADCAHQTLLAWLKAGPRTRRALVAALAASDAVRDAGASTRDPGTDPADATGFARAARTVAGATRVLEVLAEAGETQQLDQGAAFLLDAAASPSVATRLLAWSALGDLLVATANGTADDDDANDAPQPAQASRHERTAPEQTPSTQEQTHETTRSSRAPEPSARRTAALPARAFRLAALEPPAPRRAAPDAAAPDAEADARLRAHAEETTSTSPRPDDPPPMTSRSAFAPLLGCATDDVAQAAAVVRRLGAAAEAALVPGGVAPADRLAAARGVSEALAESGAWGGPSRGASEAAGKVLWALARGAVADNELEPPARAQLADQPAGTGPRRSPSALAIASVAVTRLVPAACRPEPAGARCAAALRTLAGSWQECAALVADAVDAELLRRLGEGRFAEAADLAGLGAQVRRMQLATKAGATAPDQPLGQPSALLRGVVDAVNARWGDEDATSAPDATSLVPPPPPEVETALLSALFAAVTVAARAEAMAPDCPGTALARALPPTWPLELLGSFERHEADMSANNAPLDASGASSLSPAPQSSSAGPGSARGFAARLACVAAAGGLAGAGAPKDAEDDMAVDGDERATSEGVPSVARAARVLARLAAGGARGEGAPDALPTRCVAAAAAQALAALVAIGAGRKAPGGAVVSSDALPAALEVLEPLTTRAAQDEPGAAVEAVGSPPVSSSLLAWSALGSVLRASLSGGDRRGDAALRRVFEYLETSGDGRGQGAAGRQEGPRDAAREASSSPCAATTAAVAAVVGLFADDWSARDQSISLDGNGLGAGLGLRPNSAGAGLPRLATSVVSSLPSAQLAFPPPFRQAPLWRQRALTALCRFAFEDSPPVAPDASGSTAASSPPPRCARSRALRLALAASLCASPPPARGGYATRAAPWLVAALNEVGMTSPLAPSLLDEVRAAVAASVAQDASGWPVEPHAARVAEACARLAARPAPPRVRAAALAALADLSKLPYASVHAAQPQALAAALAARDDNRRPVRAAAVAAAAAWTK